MKIALIYDAVYPWMKGGGEKALWEIAVGLTKKGHAVHLFSAQLWEGDAKIEKDGVVLHGVPAKTPFYRPDGKRSFLQPLEFAWGLFGRLWKSREEKFDVLYCTVFPYYSVFSVALFRWISGQKIPWVLAWLEVWGMKYWQSYIGWLPGLLGGSIEWLCSRCCKNHLVISPKQEQRLHSLLKVRVETINVIPRGMDFSQIPKSVSKIKQRVLYAGRFIDYKNVATILRAWPLVLAGNPLARLRLIGSGPDEQNLRELTRGLDISHTVEIFPPLTDNNEILAEIAQAEILVQPSTREGQSVVVLEAMAARTKVIAARHPDSAVTDLIQHGENGWLVDAPTDSGQWAETIVQLLREPDLFQKQIEKARQFAEQFDWETEIIPRLEDYFASITPESKTTTLFS